jgi:hypothetical protein
MISPTLPATRICRSGIVCGGGPQPIEYFELRPDGRYGRRAHCKACRRLEWKLARLKKRAKGSRELLRQVEQVRGDLSARTFLNRLTQQVADGGSAAADELLRAFAIENSTASIHASGRAGRAVARLCRLVYGSLSANELRRMAKEAINSRERERSEIEDERTIKREHEVQRGAREKEHGRLTPQTEYGDEPEAIQENADDRTAEEIERERILAMPRPRPPEPGSPLDVPQQARDMGETYCTVPEFFRSVHRAR